MTRKRSSSKGWDIPLGKHDSQSSNKLTYGEDSILNEMEGYILSESNNSAGDSLANYKKRNKNNKYNDVHSGMFYHAQNPDEMSATNKSSEDTHTISLSEIQGISGLKTNYEINRLNTISKNNIKMERLLLNQDIYNRNKTKLYSNINTRSKPQPPSNQLAIKKKRYVIKNNIATLPTLPNKQKVYQLKNCYVNNNNTQSKLEENVKRLKQENIALKTKTKNLVQELEELEIDVKQYNDEVTKKLLNVSVEHEEIDDIKKKNVLLTEEKNELKASLNKMRNKLGSLESSILNNDKMKTKHKYEIYHCMSKVSEVLRNIDTIKHVILQLKNNTAKYNNVINSIKSTEQLFNRKEVEWTENLKKIKSYLSQSKDTKQKEKKIIDGLYKTLEEQKDFIKNNYQSLSFDQKSQLRDEETGNERCKEQGILLAILETLNELKYTQKQQTQMHNFLFRSIQTQVDNLKQNRITPSLTNIYDLNINKKPIPLQRKPYRQIDGIRNRVKHENRIKREEAHNTINDTFIEKRGIVKDSLGHIEDQNKKLSEIFTFAHFNK